MGKNTDVIVSEGQTEADDRPGLVAAPTAPKSLMQRVDDAVEAWFTEHIRNSPVSQTVHAWNHVNSVKEDLKRLLVEQLS